MNHLGGASETEAYIASIWTHLQVNYCHSTLGSKVLVERLPGIKHYAGMNLKADGAGLQSMYSNTENDLNGADLMLYMGIIGAGTPVVVVLHTLLLFVTTVTTSTSKVSITMVKVTQRWENSLLTRLGTIWEWPMTMLSNTVGMEVPVQVALAILKDS